jgi:hypothetical protein
MPEYRVLRFCPNWKPVTVYVSGDGAEPYTELASCAVKVNDAANTVNIEAAEELLVDTV